MSLQIEKVREIIQPVTEAIIKLDVQVLKELRIGLIQYVEAGRVIFNGVDNASKTQMMGLELDISEALTVVAQNVREEALDSFVDGVYTRLVNIEKTAAFKNTFLKKRCHEAMTNLKNLLKSYNFAHRPIPRPPPPRRLHGPSGSGT